MSINAINQVCSFVQNTPRLKLNYFSIFLILDTKGRPREDQSPAGWGSNDFSLELLIKGYRTFTINKSACKQA